MMARLSNFRILNPVLATTRQIAEILNNTVNGKLNCIGEFTISSGTTTTTVTDPRASKDSMIFFTGLNNTITNSNPFISTRNNGSFVVTHSSHGSNVVVGYAIIG
tara:strand:+ start:2935 stop:3249 length:315 start_codon:yes stop_codon:yes gene_type:complete